MQSHLKYVGFSSSNGETLWSMMWPVLFLGERLDGWSEDIWAPIHESIRYWNSDSKTASRSFLGKGWSFAIILAQMLNLRRFPTSIRKPGGGVLMKISDDLSSAKKVMSVREELWLTERTLAVPCKNRCWPPNIGICNNDGNSENRDLYGSIS